MNKGEIPPAGFVSRSAGIRNLSSATGLHGGRDVGIGYSTQIKLVHDLLDDKEVIRKGVAEESGHGVEAPKRASSGRALAPLSSGGIGAYRSTGLTFEAFSPSGRSVPLDDSGQMRRAGKVTATRTVPAPVRTPHA